MIANAYFVLIFFLVHTEFKDVCYNISDNHFCTIHTWFKCAVGSSRRFSNILQCAYVVYHFILVIRKINNKTEYFDHWSVLLSKPYSLRQNVLLNSNYKEINVNDPCS